MTIEKGQVYVPTSKFVNTPGSLRYTGRAIIITGASKDCSSVMGIDAAGETEHGLPNLQLVGSGGLYSMPQDFLENYHLASSDELAEVMEKHQRHAHNLERLLGLLDQYKPPYKEAPRTAFEEEVDNLENRERARTAILP